MKIRLLIILLLASTPAISYESVFFCVYATDTCVDQKDAITVESENMRGLLEQVLSGGENFIGFIDSAGTTLQFFVDQPDAVWVEIPVPERKGSFGRYMSNTEVDQLITELKEPYAAYVETLGLAFTKW